MKKRKIATHNRSRVMMFVRKNCRKMQKTDFSYHRDLRDMKNPRKKPKIRAVKIILRNFNIRFSPDRQLMDKVYYYWLNKIYRNVC